MSSDYRLDRHPVVLLRPRLSYPYSWVGHIPFAYLLVDLVRPNSFVELGTHSGNSYLAVCQAVAELGIDTRCTAVDSWEGDAHALQYGSDVYSNLKAYHHPRYSRFSKLSKKFFEDAVLDFEDGTIDLLHIDGLHTYDAVKTDFETWLPKLSDRAVVILHDSEVRERDFGVWKYVEELAAKYRTFQFTHSNGLTVVEVGPDPSQDFKDFMDHALQHTGETRVIFEKIAGTLLDANGRPASAATNYEPVPVVCQIYTADAIGGYSEQHSFQKTILEASGMHEVVFHTGQIESPAFLRVDFSETPGVFAVHEITLVRTDGTTLPIDRLPDRLRYSSGALLRSSSPGTLRIAGFNQDPHVEFQLDDPGAESGSRIAAIRLSLEYEVVVNDPTLWTFMDKAAEAYAELELSHSEVAGIARRVDDFSSQLKHAQANHNAIVSATGDQLHQLTLASGKASDASATMNAILSEVTTQMDHLLRQSSAHAVASEAADLRSQQLHVKVSKNLAAGDVLGRTFDVTAGKVDNLVTQVAKNSTDIAVLNTALAEATTQLHALCNQVSRSASDTGMMNEVLTRVTSALHELGNQVSGGDRASVAVKNSLSEVATMLNALKAQAEATNDDMREVRNHAEVHETSLLEIGDLLRDQLQRIESLREQQDEQARELNELKNRKLLAKLKRLVTFR